MDRTLSIAQAREQLTRLPEQFAREDDLRAVTVTRHGKPVLAVLPWELYEAIVETLDIMADREQLAALRQGVQELARGETADWAEAKAELGL